MTVATKEESNHVAEFVALNPVNDVRSEAWRAAKGTIVTILVMISSTYSQVLRVSGRGFSG